MLAIILQNCLNETLKCLESSVPDGGGKAGPQHYPLDKRAFDQLRLDKCGVNNQFDTNKHISPGLKPPAGDSHK